METIPSLFVGTERLLDSDEFIRDSYPSSSELDDAFANVSNESSVPPDSSPAPLHENCEPIVALTTADAPPALPGSAAYTGEPFPADPVTQENLGMFWKAPESGISGPLASATALAFPCYMGVPASQGQQRHAFGPSDRPISPRPPDLRNNQNRAIQPAWNPPSHSISFSQLAGQAPSSCSGRPTFSSRPPSFSSGPPSFSSGPTYFRSGPPSFRTRPPSFSSGPPPTLQAQTSIRGTIAAVKIIDRQLSPVLSAHGTHDRGTDPGSAVSNFSGPSSVVSHHQQTGNRPRDHPDLSLRAREDYSSLSHSSGSRNLDEIAREALPGRENYRTIPQNDIFHILRNTREAPTALAAALRYGRNHNLPSQKSDPVTLHGQQDLLALQQNVAGQNVCGNLSEGDDRQVGSCVRSTSHGHAGAGNSSGARRPSESVVSLEKARKTTRKRAQFKNPKPSNFCHICTHKKELHEALVCSCIHDGLCRKVYCTQCFEKEGLSIENARDSDGKWLCFHCRDQCPQRAQCNTYNKINNTIRDKRIQRKRGKDKSRRAHQFADNNAPLSRPRPPSPSQAEYPTHHNGTEEPTEIEKGKENAMKVEDIKSDRENLDEIINSCLSAAADSANRVDGDKEEIYPYSPHEGGGSSSRDM